MTLSDTCSTAFWIYGQWITPSGTIYIWPAYWIGGYGAAAGCDTTDCPTQITELYGEHAIAVNFDETTPRSTDAIY